jgi:hypothetical protein
MEAAFDAVKRQLFDQLHDVVRARIFYVRRAPTSCMPALRLSLRRAPPSVMRHACSRTRPHPQAPPEENGGATNGNGNGSVAESEAARGR